MRIVHVHIRVKPDRVEPFKAACIANSRNNLNEPGIARFDVLQSRRLTIGSGPRRWPT